VPDEQFLTSPFLPRFHLFSHKLYFLRGPPLGPPGPGALAPATPPLSVGLMNSMLQSFDSFQGDRITIDCIEIQCDMII